MNNKVVRFPERPHYAADWSPEERQAWLARIVTLPDGRQKQYGDLTRVELRAVVYADQAELSALQAEQDAVYAEVARRAMAGDQEAEAMLAEKEAER
jgi:hypothetical protein